MLKRILIVAAMGVSAAVVSTAGPASAQKAALVIDVLGDVSPAVEPFGEVDAGTELKLAKGAELILMHYATCEEVHLESGNIRVGLADLEIGGAANVIARDPVECPEQVAFVEAPSSTGAVVLRDSGAAEIAPRPMFAAPGATRIEVSAGGELVAAMEVTGNRAVWPRSAPDLTPGEVYEIRMTGPSGVKAAAAKVRRGAGVAVLRFD